MHLLLLGVLFITTANSLSQSQNDIISSPDDSSSTPTEITQATDDVDDTWIDSAGLGSSDVQPFGSDLVSSTPSKDQPSEVDSISSTASEDQPPGSDTISSTPSGDQPLGLNLVSSAQSEETAPDCVPDASNKRKRGFLFPFFTPAKPKPALCKPRQRAGFPLEDLKWGCPRDTQPYCCARHGHSFEYFHKNRELEISLIEYCLLAEPISFDCESMPPLVGKPIEGVPHCCEFIVMRPAATDEWKLLPPSQPGWSPELRMLPWGAYCIVTHPRDRIPKNP